MDQYSEIALKKIGEGVKIMIKARKIPIEHLAAQSGISKQVIYNIINGKDYQISSLIKIFRILKVHIDFSLMDSKNNIIAQSGDNISMN